MGFCLEGPDIHNHTGVLLGGCLAIFTKKEFIAEAEVELVWRASIQ